MACKFKNEKQRKAVMASLRAKAGNRKIPSEYQKLMSEKQKRSFSKNLAEKFKAKRKEALKDIKQAEKDLVVYESNLKKAQMQLKKENKILLERGLLGDRSITRSEEAELSRKSKVARLKAIRSRPILGLKHLIYGDKEYNNFAKKLQAINKKYPQASGTFSRKGF